MQDNYYQEISQVYLIMKETSFGITHVLKSSLHYMYLKTEFAEENTKIL